MHQAAHRAAEQLRVDEGLVVRSDDDQTRTGPLRDVEQGVGRRRLDEVRHDGGVGATVGERPSQIVAPPLHVARGRGSLGVRFGTCRVNGVQGSAIGDDVRNPTDGATRTLCAVESDHDLVDETTGRLHGGHTTRMPRHTPSFQGRSALGDQDAGRDTEAMTGLTDDPRRHVDDPLDIDDELDALDADADELPDRLDVPLETPVEDAIESRQSAGDFDDELEPHT